MKAKKENYVKPLSYVIETEQALMAIGSAESSVNIGISDKAENTPGRKGIRRYEDYEDYEEEDDWSK